MLQFLDNHFVGLSLLVLAILATQLAIAAMRNHTARKAIRLFG